MLWFMLLLWVWYITLSDEWYTGGRLIVSVFTVVVTSRGTFKDISMNVHEYIVWLDHY